MGDCDKLFPYSLQVDTEVSHLVAAEADDFEGGLGKRNVLGEKRVAYSALVRHFVDEVSAWSERISHFRKLLIKVRFDLAT